MDTFEDLVILLFLTSYLLDACLFDVTKFCLLDFVIRVYLDLIECCCMKSLLNELPESDLCFLMIILGFFTFCVLFVFLLCRSIPGGKGVEIDISLAA